MSYLEIYQAIVQSQLDGEEAALATVISRRGSAPRESGTKALIKSDSTIIGTLGGGAVELQVCREALQVIAERKPKLLHFDLSEQGNANMVCGGIMDIFIEPIVPRPALYICGSGHVAVALARFATMAGMKVTVIDREEKLGQSKLPAEADLIVRQFEQFFSEITIGTTDSIVIATNSHQEDELILEIALKTPARYVGMLASRNKARTIFNHLKEKGGSEELLSKVHAPVGIEIHAETPEEIAISILAELIKTEHS